MADINLPLGFKSMHPPQFSSVRMDRIVLKGELKHDFKLKSVRIKGDEAIIRDNSFETGDIQLREGMNSMLIELTDVNGRRRLVSYSINYDPKPQSPGGGSLVDRPVLTLDMTAEGYTAPAQKKLSTRTVRRTASVSAPATRTNPNLDVVFSSPYMKQVITEDKLKIGGRFNKNAGIKAITVNEQICEMDQSSGTFKGPMLISPGEARRNNVNCDSKDYIIMKVDPIGHSGRNELKVKITPTEGKPYEDRIIYYYYQLYVGLSTYGKTYTKWHRIINDDGSIGFIENGQDAELPYSYTQSYNKNVFSEPPFDGWEYEDYNGRALNYDYAWYFWTGELQGRHWYYDIPAFYFAMDNYWNPIWYESPAGNMGPIRTINDTKLVVHTPPLEGAPFIIKLGKCEFLETSDMFIGVPELDIKDYRINGISLSKLCGDFERREGGGEEDIAYIVIDDYKIDVDMELKLEAPFYETCFDYYVLNPQGHRISHANTCNKYFYATVEDGIRGDILVDSNNDGFLGGEDNAVEQNDPGCVFWVNDDDDYNESSIHPDDGNPDLASGECDAYDDKINGIRDLEDFMPFNLTIPNINEWANTQNVKFYLKAEGQGKIRIFKRSKDMREYGAKTYLSDLDSSKSQYQEKMKFLLPPDDKKEEGQLLNPSWFDSNGNFYGIFEGIEKGSLKLILEVQLGEVNNKKRVVLDEVYLNLVDVKDMFKVYNTRYTYVTGDQEGPTEQGDKLLRYKIIREQKGYGSRFPKNPDRVIIWDHGYNNTAQQSLENATIIFKRLYRTGYRGGFIGVVWAVKNSALEFDADWLSSYRTGHVFADIVRNTKNTYPEAKLDLFAHSLGGNVACYALKILASKNEQIVDNLILHEAAVPGEVFCGEYCKINHYGNGLRDDYFDNIYADSLNALKGKVYNTYCAKDKAVGVWFPKAGALGLSTPLDDDYIFVNKEIRTQISLNYRGLGCSPADTLFDDKIISVDGLINDELHPYGIRDHGSQSREYYYDVQLHFQRVHNPKMMEKPEPDNEEEE
ncbi:MAG TPA: alpha/beta hydrolase [Candidatus Omnitrophota bacterium]|nr:alpha/beta hydrolase [Candidatus Omnitrophota bacterium]MDD5736818.1 alpha/beta hydrolase [Candidatus Omnitrophota bacterium]HOX09108.1 alpha/beta hydrolase [Candidatus Omnitrophota bacterium]